MKDLTQVELGRWLDTAPRQVQEVVLGDELSNLLDALGKKYRIHVDALGVIYKVVGYYLIGYLPEAEVLKEMRGQGLVSSDADQVWGEITEKILVPLHERIVREGVREHQMLEHDERGISHAPLPSRAPNDGERLVAVVAAGGLEPVRATPPTPEAWKPKAVTIDVLPQGIYAPPPQSPRYTSQPAAPDPYVKEVIPINKLQEMQPAKRVEPKPEVAGAAPGAPVAVARPSAPPAETRRTLSPDHLLEDHEEPHIDLRGASRVPSQALFSTLPPREAPLAPPVVKSEEPPRPSFNLHPAQTLPGSLPATSVEVPPLAEALPLPRPAPRPPTVPNRAPIGMAPLAPTPAPEHYTVDPYREPV